MAVIERVPAVTCIISTLHNGNNFEESRVHSDQFYWL